MANCINEIPGLPQEQRIKLLAMINNIELAVKALIQTELSVHGSASPRELNELATILESKFPGFKDKYISELRKTERSRLIKLTGESANAYTVLGISADTPKKTVKHRLEVLLLLFHPDRNQEDNEAETITKLLLDAKNILGL